MAADDLADRTVDLLNMIGQLAEALGTAKELIDNLHGRTVALERRIAALEAARL